LKKFKTGSQNVNHSLHILPNNPVVVLALSNSFPNLKCTTSPASIYNKLWRSNVSEYKYPWKLLRQARFLKVKVMSVSLCHVRVLSPIYFPSMCVARHAFLDHPVASSVHSGVMMTGTSQYTSSAGLAA